MPLVLADATLALGCLQQVILAHLQERKSEHSEGNMLSAFTVAGNRNAYGTASPLACRWRIDNLNASGARENDAPGY